MNKLPPTRRGPVRSPRSLLADQRGYVMIVALLLMALIAIIGSSTLQVAGIDQRVALQNRKHMMVLNTASAGTDHARDELQNENPPNEGIDTATDTFDDFVSLSEAEADFGGSSYAHNLGVYYVTATYHRCGNPPPGYSTEMGRNAFRSDYWEMESTARMTDTSYTNVNETEAVSSALIRKVMQGRCKIR